jgi:hypothetical protein
MAFEPYEPDFTNPYTDEKWKEITEFKYDTPLRLYRAIETVQQRDGDDADYLVAEPYSVRIRLDDRPYMRITVPKGLVTDLASVPRFAQSVVGRVGPHLEASIVHDFMYVAWQCKCMAGRGAKDKDRRFADEVFLAGMKEAGMEWVDRQSIYEVVRLAGDVVYKAGDAVRFVTIPADPPLPAGAAAPRAAAPRARRGGAR